MDSILKPITLSESKRRWQVLLDRQAQAESWLGLCPPGRHKGKKLKKDGDNTEEDDNEEDNPFDVGSVAIPTVHALVENLLEDYILQWQQLDFRKITDDNNDGTTSTSATATADTNNANNEGETTAKKRRKFWHRNYHLKMPDQFDYTTQNANPPNDEGTTTTAQNNSNITTGSGTGARVMNLLDPTQSIPYEQALWELFEQVPTLEDIEAQVREGHQMHETEQIMAEILEGYQNYTRIDAHALSQLRINDRHDMPPQTNTPGGNTNSNNKNLPSTIRLECWRRETNRGPAADQGRAIFEFQGTQTLADVHQTIVELTEDGLWEQISSRTQDNNQNNTAEPDSGYFFIENTFYTIGSVDYVTPILNWLGDSAARKAYLGITSSSPLQIKPMSEAILQEIPFRLGVRYHHVHHGDVECAIFVIDLHHGNYKNQGHHKKLPHATKPQTVQPIYPLVHDTWTATYPSVECEGCQKYTVSVVTTNHCELSQGHRALCQECSEILLGSNSSNSSNIATDIAEGGQQHNDTPTNDLPHTTRDSTTFAAAGEAETEEEDNSEEHASMLTQPYSVWKSQPTLSTGAGNTLNFLPTRLGH